MTQTSRSVLKQALKLPPTERAQLIEELYSSFGDAQAHLRAWADEVEERIDAQDAGILKASSAAAVLKRINRR